ncbi:MAG: phosphate/phosphite/phosphonate ABC transporter substrate-binding protein [SAR324 cluster bacterium]|nr:phosphate/phosphite/phosphonate ABC transporter substrate-binding protein [SAR324 cluster bacterium]
MLKTKITIFILALLWVFTSPVHAGEKTIRMAVSDLDGIEQVQRQFGAFRDFLIKKTGLNIEFYPISSRTSAVEGMKSKKIDFILTGPAEYVVFRQRVKAEPVVGFFRPEYYGLVVVLSDSPYHNLNDLKGKKVALGPVGSTSKHLAPMQLFADAGMTPKKDIKAVHTSVKIGWESLLRGRVQGFGTNSDKLAKLRGKMKDSDAGKIRVIARGGDLPSDVLLVRKGFDPKITKQLKDVFVNQSAQLLKAILEGEDNIKYTQMKFLPTVDDKDYNYVRNMYRTAGYAQFSKFIDE